MGVTVDIGSGGLAELVVPDGYEVSVFAQGLISPRFMSVSPDGVLFVAERGADRVVALPDRDADGRADETIEVGRGYESAHSVAFAPDGGLLVAGETTLFRLRLGADLREAERSVVLEGLTTGGHSTRTVAVLPDGQLLLSAGSTCNVCVESDPRRAAINLVPPEGSLEPGLYDRSSERRRRLGRSGDRTRLGDEHGPRLAGRRPAARNRLRGGRRRRCRLAEAIAGDLVDPEFGSEAACEGVADPAVTFGAHMAPLALVGWEDHLVVALHGSWNRSDKAGYALWWLQWDGEPAGEAEPFATGFLPEGAEQALGRPAGLAVGADGALYVSDDKGGYIYRIVRR